MNLKRLFLLSSLFFVGNTLFSQTTGSFNTTIQFNSTSHTIAYYVPSSYDSTLHYPLIVALHGCGGNAITFRNSFTSLADSINAILVCPDFMGNQLIGTNGQLIVRAIDSTIIDLNYSIDTAEVYLTGFSCNGQETMKQGWANIYPFKGLITLNAWTPNLTGYLYANADIPTCICSGTIDFSHSNNQTIYNNLIANNKDAYWNPMPGINHFYNFASRDSEMMECFNWLDTLGQSAIVNCDSLSASASNMDTLCIVNGTNSIVLGGSPSAFGGIPPYQYLWSYDSIDGVVSDSTIANPIATVTSRYSSFILTVTDSLGCEAKDTVVIDKACFPSGISCDSLVVSASILDTLCLGSGINSIRVGGSPSASGGNPPYNYSWTNTSIGGFVSDSTMANPLATVFSRYSSFVLRVTDSLGCVATDTVVIDTACSGMSTSFFENLGSTNLSIYPNPSDGLFYFDNSGFQVSSMVIYDALGNIIMDNSNQTTRNGRIDLTLFSDGLYFLKVMSNNGKATVIKLVKGR